MIVSTLGLVLILTPVHPVVKQLPPVPAIECPACPGDAPWRPITCYILSHGEPPTREECP